MGHAVSLCFLSRRRDSGLKGPGADAISPALRASAVGRTHPGDARTSISMKVNVRRSKAKWLKSVGFLTRMKTKGGRSIIKRHRRLGRRLTPKQP